MAILFQKSGTPQLYGLNIGFTSSEYDQSNYMQNATIALASYLEHKFRAGDATTLYEILSRCNAFSYAPMPLNKLITFSI